MMTDRQLALLNFKLLRATVGKSTANAVATPAHLLTDAERTRHDKTSTMLAENENPYTKDNREARGGSANDLGKRERISVSVPDIPASIVAERQAKWSKRDFKSLEVPKLTVSGDYARSRLGLDLVRPAKEVVVQHVATPGVFHCSYCYIEVPYHEATFGQSKERLIKKVRMIPLPSGDGFQEDIRWIPIKEKRTACKLHALEIVKEGGTIKFPESEG